MFAFNDRLSARLLRFFAMPLLLSLGSCDMNPTGLEMSAGWEKRSVAVWRNTRPDMLALSPNGKWLYISCETTAATNAPSLVAINMETGRQHFLLFGLMRADALKFAPDGSLWIGEEFPEGLIWRISDVDKLPAEQSVDRLNLLASNDSLQPYRPAGRFAHEGLSFSLDGKFAYLADEQEEGGIYRLRLTDRSLSVLDRDMRWQAVTEPLEARAAATRAQAATFNRLEDMETLPDGRILLAETDTGKILALTEHGDTASIETLLHDERIVHPDNLAWDAKRRLLWITDDDKPSALWAWDGRQASRIALHKKAEITGVLPVGDDIYINLQGVKGGPELTVRIFEKPAQDPANP
ncbi:MAG: hypothetical protein COS82_04765 [Zetaproteobacteria bacterium CG06_land_8_20_14_3_00_59_53]|nr:MAG: hypothetical protein AUK36_08010 [Zetaproteobacteria bacterium CG2_30_59_37]PIO88931.1 MAG: hypothetical protein COX56_10870 [Zetaproteobacteria bacterium CG23_combo_of_CG06-09_8_20_14_all_59_86]PIQ65234.1 MAG: hypothetical protein COV97_05450 [Zetaproteobacteria bacterium CG11_big_fil_rev_8_21_14_0_20_59_439]PIU70812.1 MAG: hypothetical protein COS82_04765 [Zetaproteobacteria bacterium CG06_land_8_20_14_3_00_59_53]PIU96484.1 MAG: hypothetical protein COS62_09100 [Zetaproteobacteria bac